MMRRGTLIASLLALLLGPAPSARAFERSTVDDDPSTYLFWRYRTVLVRMASGTADDLPPEAVEGALARSIASWNAAAAPCSDFLIRDAGAPTGLRTNLDGGEHDGENRIVFREDAWPEDVPEETLALTTLVYRRASGQILDADIDLNGVSHYWTDTTEPGTASADVENTLTHELGHLLGLAHAPDPAATMYLESVPGDLEKRSLAEDDIAGLCHIYPEGLLSPGAPPLTGTPLRGSCGVARAPGRGGVASALAVLALAACGLRRRARAQYCHRG